MLKTNKYPRCIKLIMRGDINSMTKSEISLSDAERTLLVGYPKNP